ncbi:MAG: hypothetical protein Hyperionvirus12_33 [Hyperionvirus sp.]|uniref:Uncharacterized protein n=1 Tax=Hyperionvirus sp. TaxID=2487770 RepID=A0A3G5A980_9VIRU|nr:MAG: hypothetical protein Hyperionvirus12_33 [Hyperionvirus sp.]
MLTRVTRVLSGRVRLAAVKPFAAVGMMASRRTICVAAVAWKPKEYHGFQRRFLSLPANEAKNQQTRETPVRETYPPVTHVTHVNNYPQESNFRFIVNKFGGMLKFIFWGTAAMIVMACVFSYLFFPGSKFNVTKKYVEINMFGFYMKVDL